MSLDGKLLKRAIGRLKDDKDRRDAELAERREEVYKKQPRIRQIENELRLTVVEAASSAFRGGEDVAGQIEELKEKNLRLQSESVELLIEAGYPGDYLEEKYMCSRCMDRGFLKEGPCTCLLERYKEEQRKELSSLLNLGEENFEKFKLSWYSEDYDPKVKDSPRRRMKVVLDFCRFYADNFGETSENIFMSGGTGLGKTFLSTSIAKVVAENGFSVVYASAVDVFANFEEEQFSHSEAEDAEREIRRYLNCDLFILDDLGTEMSTSFTASVLYRIINTRLGTKKKTIINSNLDIEALQNRYSPQVLSRLRGEYRQLNFAGKDIRLQKRSL